MKNRDKYGKILMDYAMVGVRPALAKKGSVTRCNDFSCEECVWNGDCEDVKLKWLDEEYREPNDETEWSKVPVDTPIYVGRTMEDVEGKKKPRYFAEYKNGRIYAWDCGMTSFTAHGSMFEWSYVKLAEVQNDR